MERERKYGGGITTNVKALGVSIHYSAHILLARIQSIVHLTAAHWEIQSRHVLLWKGRADFRRQLESLPQESQKGAQVENYQWKL
jgi:hypothetical protein